MEQTDRPPLPMFPSITEPVSNTDTLLREINHRVGGSLQLISGLLHRAEMNIHAGADPKTCIEVLRTSQRQVVTIALVQRLIYGKAADRARLTEFLQTLIVPLKTIHERPNINLLIEEYCVVTPRQVQPVGLILSELIANALRHGYDPESTGTIRIRIDRDPPDTLFLLVEDDGKGLITPPPVRAQGGLGIVRDLAEECGGQMRWRSRLRGTALEVMMLLAD